MFSKIRIRLTLLYSGIMALFLVAFVIATLTGLAGAVYWSERHEVLGFAEEEIREQAVVLKNPKFQELLNNENVSSGIMFVYAYDNSGNLVEAERAHQSVETTVLARIANWEAPYGEVITLTVDKDSGDNAIVMMASQPVMDGAEILGKVYVGRDVTSYYHAIKTVIFVLAGISLIFLLLASGGGYIMAGRAIVPINKSYERQRQFVADASHELRTPLSVLMASIDAIHGDEDITLSLFTKQVLDDMKDELRKMTKIVSDMLTLARADAITLSVLKEKFELTAVVEQVVRSLQPLAKEKGIQLGFEAQGELSINADRERIKQLLLILLDNGIKYTPQNGEVRVALELSKMHNDLKIAVIDSGIGIPSEQRELIFERFYRVDKARSREAGGSGLGLAIAKWIVEAHGGKIQVSSRAQQGSVFTVVLPQ